MQQLHAPVSSPAFENACSARVVIVSAHQRKAASSQQEWPLEYAWTHCGGVWLSVRGLRQSVIRARNSFGGAARKPLRLRLSRNPSTSTAALVPLTNHFLAGGWRGLLLPLLLPPSPPVLALLVLFDPPTHSSRAAGTWTGDARQQHVYMSHGVW